MIFMKVFMSLYLHIVALFKEILVTESKLTAPSLNLCKLSKFIKVCTLYNHFRVHEEDHSKAKSVSTAITIAENIVHDIQIPFDINHFLYIGKFQMGYRNPQTEQGSCMYKFSPDSFDSNVCEIRQIQRTDMYKMKNLGSVSNDETAIENLNEMI